MWFHLIASYHTTRTNTKTTKSWYTGSTTKTTRTKITCVHCTLHGALVHEYLREELLGLVGMLYLLANQGYTNWIIMDN